MKAIMYHYVRPTPKEYPQMRYLSLDDFRRQLDYFEKHFGFIDQRSFIQSIDCAQDQAGVVLTFDDGFKDHYQFVLPELKRRNLWGLFYVSTGHYQTGEKKLLGVHRVHHLLGKCDHAQLFQEALALIDASALENDHIAEFDKEIYKDQQNSEWEYKIKRLFNYYIKYEFRDPILNELTRRHLDEPKLYDELYLTPQEMIEIENAGSIIGSHTENHYVLSRLDYDSQYREIKKSFDYLSGFLRLPIKSFCYPYGGESSYNFDTLKVLKELDIHDAFVVLNKEITQSTIARKFELTRLDCNRF